LVISLFLAFILFNMTTTAEKTKYLSGGEIFTGLEFSPPPTMDEKPKPKLPPPVAVELVPVADIKGSQENLDFLRTDIDVNDQVSYYPVDTIWKKSHDIPVADVNTGVSEPIIIAEIMPRFPGCEDLPTNQERDYCAQQKLMEYIYKNLRYPALAAETGVEGRVTIRFVVTEYGNVENVEILRDIGAGCGEEAKKVIENMNTFAEKWIPGRQGGRKVKVFFTLPVVFELKK